MRSPPGDRPRGRANGFSLVETLVILSIFGIVAGLVMECAIGGVTADKRLAARADDGTVRLAGAAVFHALLRDARLVRGDVASIEIARDDVDTLGCAVERGVIRLTIDASDRGGHLRCAPAADRRPLLRWQSGTGRFRFSGTAQDKWRDHLPRGDQTAMLVRLELADGSRDPLTWTERVGDTR